MCRERGATLGQGTKKESEKGIERIIRSENEADRETDTLKCLNLVKEAHLGIPNADQKGKRPHVTLEDISILLSNLY